MRALVAATAWTLFMSLSPASWASDVPARQGVPHPVLLEGFGIDHVILAVRDLEAARTLFRDRLGFKLPPDGVFGLHATGTKNASSYFANQSYLELLAIADADKVERIKPAAARYLAGGSGAIGFALSTSSAPGTAERLRQLGVAHRQPPPGTIERPGSKAPAKPKWLTVDPDSSLKLPFFFIQYLDMDYADIFRNWESGFAEAAASNYYAQPNTATGLSAIWIVVPDVEAVVATYRRLLGGEGTRVTIPDLAAEGHVFPVVRQRIYLLQPTASAGPAADHVASRGSGVMGVSMAVKSLKTAASRLDRGAVKVDGARRGPMSRSGLVVPPSEALGVWIEFHEGD